MKPKDKKQEELDALKKDLAEATNLIVAQFKGITVEQDTELRNKVRATNSKTGKPLIREGEETITFDEDGRVVRVDVTDYQDF